jgi:hypothetical protein
MIKLDQLLLQIARCEFAVGDSARSETSHCCHKIVQLQPQNAFQLPEPWSGQIDKAPILFISSNPSITQQEYYPDNTWRNENIIDFFQNRFTTPNGPAAELKALFRDGNRARVNNYWAHARARTSEVLGKPKNGVKAGVDFALTEIVHCKSRNEVGVKEAREFCFDRYFNSVLSIAIAPVFIVYGKHAAKAMQNRFCHELKSLSKNLNMLTTGGQSRIVAFMPAPAAFKLPKGLLENLGEEGLKQIRAHLRANKPSENRET